MPTISNSFTDNPDKSDREPSSSFMKLPILYDSGAESSLASTRH